VKAVQVHTDLDESAEAMKEALRDLLSTVETVATEAGVVSGLVDSITASMNQMESRAQTVIQLFCHSSLVFQIS
jgi:talin